VVSLWTSEMDSLVFSLDGPKLNQADCELLSGASIPEASNRSIAMRLCIATDSNTFVNSCNG
jgi:hypothetical protein